MIQDYKLIQQDGEEILYLYINFNVEFAKLNENAKKKELSKIVSDFMKEHNIKFHGTKVAIIVGGLLMATIALNEPNHIESTPSYQYTPQSVISLNANIEIPKKEEIKTEEKKPAETIKEEKKSTASTNKTPSKVTPTKPVIKEPVKTDTNDATEVIDTNTYVTIKRNNGIIVKMELEEYLIGVVGSEMPASFHIEALKAQAIIARTYALKTIENHVQLTDDSRTQNYKDPSELQQMWGSGFSSYYAKVKKAVEETKGMYLTYQGTIVDAVYHSTSNGRTEDAKYVWGKSEPYLVPVESPYDTLNKTFEESTYISYEKISEKLGMIVTKDSSFEIGGMTSGNRIETITVDRNSFTGAKFRSLLQLKSTDFTIQKDENGIIFTTKGWGHGVGLSQYGAYGMARNGSSYEEILKHYYKGVELSKL